MSSLARPKVCLVSVQAFCKPNSVLSSRCMSYFEANGWELTRSYSEADFLVINTCGFEDRAQQSSRTAIAEICAAAKPGAKVVSIGCLNKINPRLLEDFQGLIVAADIADLDRLIGAEIAMNDVEQFHFDAALFTRLGKSWGFNGFVDRMILKFGRFLCWAVEGWPYPRVSNSHLPQVLDEIDPEPAANRIYIGIGSGCVGACSYCVIKRARGPTRSRPLAAIIGELKLVYTPGRVIHLVADDCGSWGADTGKTVFELVAEIAREFPSAPIDFCYINPYWLERYPCEYVEMCRTACINSLNISLQSGSDRIIAAMNRRYRVANVLRVMGEIKAASPRTMLWSHLMVGYPGETWSDLWQTMRAAAHFHAYMVFPYSRLRDDQPAYERPSLPRVRLTKALVGCVQYVMMAKRLLWVRRESL